MKRAIYLLLVLLSLTFGAVSVDARGHTSVHRSTQSAIRSAGGFTSTRSSASPIRRVRLGGTTSRVTTRRKK